MWFFKRLSNILALTSSLGLLSASAKTLPSILSLSLTVVCVCVCIHAHVYGLVQRQRRMLFCHPVLLPGDLS